MIPRNEVVRLARKFVRNYREPKLPTGATTWVAPDRANPVLTSAAVMEFLRQRPVTTSVQVAQHFGVTPARAASSLYDLRVAGRIRCVRAMKHGSNGWPASYEVMP